MADSNTSFNVIMNADQVAAVVRSSLLAYLSPEKRDELIRMGIDKILHERVDNTTFGGDHRTQIQKAFDSALYEQCASVAADAVGSAAVKDKLLLLVQKGIEDALATGDLQARIARAITKALVE